MSKDFFDHNTFFIDEKVAFIKLTNSYKIFDEDGNQIGSVQQKMSRGYKFLSFLVSKSMFPLALDIMDMDGRVLISLRRGWKLLLSKISLLDERGSHIANINQKFKLLKAEFHIVDTAGGQIGRILGDWKSWNFTITDIRDAELGVVTKKWAGLLKEAFTTADKYVVSIKPTLTDMKRRKTIIASAIVIDMILTEGKR
jgi:uncharacterized protein YxjI